MNRHDRICERLAAAARRAVPEPPEPQPPWLAARVLAKLRDESQGLVWWEDLALRGAAGACAVAALSCLLAPAPAPPTDDADRLVASIVIPELQP